MAKIELGGEGFQADLTGDILTIKMDISKIGAVSDSGKSKRIASSLGNTTIRGMIKMGLNVYEEIPKHLRKTIG